MTSARDKVLELVAAGRISGADAHELLGAMRPRRPLLARWASPFDALSTPRLWALALATQTLALTLSRFGAHFDGALDLHIAPGGAPWSQSIAEQLASWPLTATILWLASVALARKGRWVDFIMLVGAARAPLVVAGCVVLPLLRGAAEPGAAAWLTGLAMMLLFPCIICLVMWLVAALRTASGLKGGRLAAAFVVGVTAAEVLSKAALALQ